MRPIAPLLIAQIALVLCAGSSLAGTHSGETGIGGTYKVSIERHAPPRDGKVALQVKVAYGDGGVGTDGRARPPMYMRGLPVHAQLSLQFSDGNTHLVSVPLTFNMWGGRSYRNFRGSVIVHAPVPTNANDALVVHSTIRRFINVAGTEDSNLGKGYPATNLK